MDDKKPAEDDDLFDDSVLDEVVDLDAETPHPDIEPGFVAEEEEAVEEAEPVEGDDFEVTEELGDAAVETETDEFEVAEEATEAAEPADDFNVTEEPVVAVDGLAALAAFEPEPAAENVTEDAFTEEAAPEEFEAEEAADDADATAEDEFAEATDEEFTEEPAADAESFEEEPAEGEAPAEDADFDEAAAPDDAKSFEEEPAEGEAPAEDADFDEAAAPDDEAGPRRGGAADRYQKTAKPPPTKGKKRMMAALIISLPVLFVGIIIAGFFIRQPYYPNIDGSPEVNAWQKMFILLKISDEPPRPEIVRPPEDDTPEPPRDSLVEDYGTELGLAMREAVRADVLQGQLDAEAAEQGLTEPSKELKKKYFWEADKKINRITSAEARLKQLWADMEAKAVEGITPQKHTENMGNLASMRIELETFREANRPSGVVDGTESGVTPKDPSPLIAQYRAAYADGKGSVRDAASLRTELEAEQGGAELTRALARKYADLAGESIGRIGELETRLKELMTQMETEGVAARPTEDHQANLEEFTAMRAALEQFRDDNDPTRIVEMPTPSPLLAQYDSAFSVGKENLIDAGTLRSGLRMALEEAGLTSPSRELAEQFHGRAGTSLGDLDALEQRLKSLIEQMEGEGVADIPTEKHQNNLTEIADLRQALESFRDEVDPSKIADMPTPSPLPGEYAQLWESRTLNDAAVLRSNLRAELEALGLAAPNREVAGKHYDLAGEAIAAVDALHAELERRMAEMADVPDRPDDAHREHLAELAAVRRDLESFREAVDPSKIAVTPPPPVEDTPLRQFEALREALKRAGLDESIALLRGYLDAGPEDRFRGWAEQEIARLEKIKADRAAAEVPEIPRKTPDDMIREGTELVVKCAEAVKRLIKTEIPDDSTAQLALRLESEDVLAGLDDAEFKYTRALAGIKDDPSRAEDVKKLDASVIRIRQLRKAFSEDFVRRLDRKTGG